MDKPYKVVEVVGTSQESIEAAIECALHCVGKEQDKVNWFEVKETRGFVTDGKVGYYQVCLKVGCSF